MIHILNLSIGSIWGNVWPVLVAILLFLILIFIHEFGHFIVAKLMGIQVNEFAIGFGPAIYKKQGKKTLYSVRILPFGGYCAMEGEDEISDNENAFCNKAPWRRFLVVIAGAVFNIIFGLIVVFVMLLPSERFASTTVASFEDGAISQQSGLEQNDKIYKVDGRRIYTTYDLSYALTGIKEDSVKMVVIRNGQKVDLGDVHFTTSEEQGVKYINLDFKVYGIKNNFGNLLAETGKTTLSYARIVWFSLVDLISGKYGISQVSGPVGVVKVVSEAAKVSMDSLLYLAALITINLGIFNLLPVPALDGSRALIILAEMVTRKKLPAKVESLIHGIGFVVLILLMILIAIKDIYALF